MNLTKSLKDLILHKFKAGAGTEEIAAWYGQKSEKIEAVIRDYMLYELGGQK